MKKIYVLPMLLFFAYAKISGQQAAERDYTKGYFMVNEDWFGHYNGSVNFMDSNNQPYYRVYSEKNNNETFGATTQYGTIYGDKFYFVSKQNKDNGDKTYKATGKLVVANALTMEKIAAFELDSSKGDGRSFVGVNSKTGYFGSSIGVFVFDIEKMQMGDKIAGIKNGQIGNMIRTSQYVFAIQVGEGIHVIDPKNHNLKTTIKGPFNSVIQAKDGSVWAIKSNAIVQIATSDFSLTEYAFPKEIGYSGWAGAWNAGSLTYSNKQNALYWVNKPNIVKFDVTSKTFNGTFAVIPGQNETPKHFAYGSMLRVNPLTDELIVNTTKGSYSNSNWYHSIDSEGNLKSSTELMAQYWFPALTVFPDANAPVISASLPDAISVNEKLIVDLKDKISDDDNLSMAIVKTLVSNSNESIVEAVVNETDELILTPKNIGSTNIVLSFNSNGKEVEHTLNLTVTSLSTREQVKKLDFQIYPNPVSEVLSLKTTEKIKEVRIFDTTGRALPTQEQNGSVDVRNLEKGIYILKVQTDKNNYTQKFIKK